MPRCNIRNNRIARLKTRAKYEITSISTNRGAINKGAPDGKNRLNKANPCKVIPVKFKLKKYKKEL